MPRGKGVPIGAQRGNLNLLGGWIWWAIDYTHITLGLLALRTGINKGTISNMLKVDGKYSLEAVAKVVMALEAIAEEKGIAWSSTFSDEIYHGAGFSSEQEREKSEKSLKVIQEYAKSVASGCLKQNKERS